MCIEELLIKLNQDKQHLDSNEQKLHDFNNKDRNVVSRIGH